MEDAFVQWSIFIIVAAFIFRYFIELGTYKLIISSVIGVEMVIVVRYIYDKLYDSTRDPQIFFVLIVAFFIGALSAGAGIFLANQLRSKGKSNEDSRSKTELESTKKESKNNKPSDNS